MMLRLGVFGTVALALLSTPCCRASRFSKLSFVRNRWNLSSKLQAEDLLVSSVPRGGSTEAAEDVVEETVDAQDLYLPGLLDVDIVKSDSVGHDCNLSC